METRIFKITINEVKTIQVIGYYMQDAIRHAKFIGEIKKGDSILVNDFYQVIID